MTNGTLKPDQTKVSKVLNGDNTALKIDCSQVNKICNRVHKGVTVANTKLLINDNTASNYVNSDEMICTNRGVMATMAKATDMNDI